MSITDADDLVEVRHAPHQWEYNAGSERNSLYSGKRGIEGVLCKDCPAEGFRTFELVPNDWNSAGNPDDFRPPYLRKLGTVTITSGHTSCPAYELRTELEATLIVNGLGYFCGVAIVIAGAVLLYVYRQAPINRLPAVFWFALCPMPFALSMLHGFIRQGHRELKRVRAEMAKIRAGWVPVALKVEASGAMRGSDVTRKALADLAPKTELDSRTDATDGPFYH